MYQRIFIIILLSIPFLFCHTNNSFADTQGERFNFEYKYISQKTLMNTIGIVSIRYIENKIDSIKTYIKEGHEYIFEKYVYLKETKPISDYGYHLVSPEDLLLRYPIIANTGGYLCIVYEPSEYLTVWIKDENYTKLFFDKMPCPSSFFVDIFRFTTSGKRKIYISPDKKSKYFIISKTSYRYPPLFTILKQNGDFIKIGLFSVDNNYKEIITPIGWVKMKDALHRLTIWIDDEDTC